MAINLVQKPQGGGILGAIGTVLGAIGGGAAALLTGGAALPAIAAGTSIGKTAGGIGDAITNKANQPKGVGDFNVVEGKPQMGAADVIGKAGDLVGLANSASQNIDKIGGYFSKTPQVQPQTLSEEVLAGNKNPLLGGAPSKYSLLGQGAAMKKRYSLLGDY